MQLKDATFQITFNGKTEIFRSDKMTFFDKLYVESKLTQVVDSQSGVKGVAIAVMVHPKQPVRLEKLEIILPKSYQQSKQILCNGYQSWSATRCFTPSEKIPRPNVIMRHYMPYHGDHHISEIKRGKGQLHSWTYTTIQPETSSLNQFELAASLDETTAFTLFQHDTNTGQLHIQSDCANLDLEHSMPLLNVVLLRGEEQACFDKWQDLYVPHLPEKKTTKTVVGWTSWYHYYTDISEEIILKNLNAYTAANTQIDYFQIDDGWQKTIGDWLDIRDTFPNGMQNIRLKISDLGIKAGLWLAPFVCDKRSKIYRDKQHWLLKDEAGKLLKIGHIPLWGGDFFALNIYDKEVQDYLSKVLLTVFEKWGFDLVKLDFLYAVCARPPKGKTRGQVMAFAMDFLQKIAGKKQILACGVPLGSAFGVVDYCRIGPDVHLSWENKQMKWLKFRERTSTLGTLRTTLNRWQLNNRFFGNDPDVFILRSEKNKLNTEQQYTLLLVNVLLGKLVFTSDFITDYTPEQWSEYQQVMQWKNCLIKEVKPVNIDQYRIQFVQAKKHYIALVNLSKKIAKFSFEKQEIKLSAFESIVLKS